MTLSILDTAKKTLNSSDLTYFNFLNEFEPNLALVSEVIRLELMNLRQPNAHTKTRAEVRGGGKKPWRQKGTGRARHGSTRSPIWVGGGITFGPRNERNWHRKINKSAKVSALKSILADRFNNSRLVVAPEIKVVKTKDATDLVNVFRKENVKNKVAVFYSNDEKQDLSGLRNLPGVDLINITNLSLWRMANSHYYVFTDKSAQFISDRLTK